MPTLGRRVPKDWHHVEKYGFSLPLTVANVERRLSLISARAFYNQGVEGACVGFSCSWMMSILNRYRYDAPWLYHEAKRNDDWPGEDYDGTSVRAGLDVLRTQGHSKRYMGKTYPANPIHGISANRWAKGVDDVRAAISLGIPCVLGTNWYEKFFSPVKKWPRWWIGQEANWGQVAGGHAICICGASDKIEAVRLVNSWGTEYPLVWLPYRALERLMNEEGEVGLVTDR